MKSVLLIVGILWSGGLLTAQVFKAVDLGTNRDFFLGVFGGCCTGLGLSNKKFNPIESNFEPLKKDDNGFY